MNSFWSNLYDTFKDRRYAASFSGILSLRLVLVDRFCCR